MDGPAEIGQLDGLVVKNENVLRFQIAVDDVEAVYVLHRRDYLRGVEGTPALLEFASALQNRVEFAPRSVFHYYVDAL